MELFEKFKLHQGHQILISPTQIRCRDCQEKIIGLAPCPRAGQFKKIYLCSALRASTPEGIHLNILRAQAGAAALKLKYGCPVVAPHAYLPSLLDETKEDERRMALDFGLRLLDCCDALAICSQPLTAGMIGEIAHAAENNLTIFAEWPHSETPEQLMEFAQQGLTGQ